MKQKFLKDLADKFFLRFHMSLILTLMVSSGFFSSKILYNLGVENLTLRYSLSFLISYLMFFLCIRIWLFYVFSTRSENNDSFDWWDFDLWFKGSRSKAPGWKSGEGKFSGGGASSSFDKASLAESKMAVIAPPVSKSSGLGFDLDLDADVAPLVVVLLVVGFILIALGSFAYLVFNAPMVLGDVAFQLALSLGILKNEERKSHPFEWMSEAFKKTWGFALVILILIMATTLTINHYKPEITKSSEIKEWLLGIKNEQI